MANFDPRRIPIIGDDLRQAGQVYQIMSQPCGPDPWIAVRAAWTYAPTLIWALLKPDPLDLAFDRAGVRHRRIGKRRFKAVDLMQLDAPRKPGVSLATFNIAQATQRIGWYLLIADATTDFAINWASMAYGWSGCHVAGVPWAKAEGGSGQLLGGLTSPGSLVWTVDTWEYQHPGFASSDHVAISDNGPKTISAQFWPRHVNSGQYQGVLKRVYLLRTNHDGTTTTRDAEQADPGNPASPFAVTESVGYDFTPPVSWRFRVEITGGLVYNDGCAISATGAPAAGLTFDP